MFWKKITSFGGVLSVSRKFSTTFLTNEACRARKGWVLFDAEGVVLGRLASEISKILRGRHLVDYTPHVNCGSGVVVINAAKVVVSGRKDVQKRYFRHTGYPGGGRMTLYKDLMKRHPERIIFHAVKGMMPKTKLSDAQMRFLRVFPGQNHVHQAQKPVEVNING